MKKLFAHLSLLCLMALLLVPMVACNRGGESEVEETPAATTETTTMEEPTTTTPMDTGMTTDMGTDTGMTTDNMTTETTPPAQ